MEETSSPPVAAGAHGTLQCSLELGSGNGRGERNERLEQGGGRVRGRGGRVGQGFSTKLHGGFCTFSDIWTAGLILVN